MPAAIDIDIAEKIAERLEAIKEFIRQNQALLIQQKHLDEGSSERAYWHAGYASALADVLNLISGTRRSFS